jgi:DNA-binding MarR family transcriptional regulator
MGYADPVPSSRPDLLALIHPLARALRRIEDGAAARHGLSMWQYAVLSVASVSPGLSQRQIAEAMQYSANRLIADVDELERQGALRRKPGEDRRANLLHITPSGRALQARIQAEIHDGEDELLAEVPSRSRQQLLGVLAQIARQLRPE